MNRQQRRHAAKVLSLRTEYDDDEVCRLCAFVTVQLIGGKAPNFTDDAGRVIPLPMNERLAPPHGLRWPQAEGTDDEWAPLCMQCAQFVMSWLEARSRAHAARHAPAGGKIMVATPGMLSQALDNMKQLEQQIAKTPGTTRILRS